MCPLKRAPELAALSRPPEASGGTIPGQAILPWEGSYVISWPPTMSISSAGMRFPKVVASRKVGDGNDVVIGPERGEIKTHAEVVRLKA